MKTLSWFLTAAAILIGADVFIASSDQTAPEATADERPYSVGGTNGDASPPPD